MSSSFIFGVILPTSSEAKILNFNLSSRFCICLLSVVVSPPGCIVATVLVVVAMLLRLTLLETVALLPIVLGKLLVVAVVKAGTLVEVTAAVSAAVSTLVTVVVVSASVASVAVLGPGVDVVGVAAAHANALVLGADAGL